VRRDQEINYSGASGLFSRKTDQREGTHNHFDSSLGGTRSKCSSPLLLLLLPRWLEFRANQVHACESACDKMQIGFGGGC
jgi:hypothetical protein